MASQLDVVNEALVRIGEKRIASISDTKDPNAVLASALWAETVKQVSRETPWKCLRRLQRLRRLRQTQPLDGRRHTRFLLTLCVL